MRPLRRRVNPEKRYQHVGFGSNICCRKANSVYPGVINTVEMWIQCLRKRCVILYDSNPEAPSALFVEKCLLGAGLDTELRLIQNKILLTEGEWHAFTNDLTESTTS